MYIWGQEGFSSGNIELRPSYKDYYIECYYEDRQKKELTWFALIAELQTT